MKLENVLKELEVNYGWSFYDEKGKLHLEDMQKELLQDTIKAVKNLCISDANGSLLLHSSKIELLDRYTKFLQKRGYIDTDATCEEPFAIDEFLCNEAHKAVKNRSIPDVVGRSEQLCPQCNSHDLFDIDDHYTKCQDCGFLFVGA